MTDTPMAFPFDRKTRDGISVSFNAGMTLRDYFAGQALAGQMANAALTADASGPTEMAVSAYAIADAMLIARGKGKYPK